MSQPAEVAPRRNHPAFWSTVLLSPLWAVPFALFFGVLFGGTPTAFWIAFRIALVFALVIRIVLYGTARWLSPMLRIRERDDAWLPIGALYLTTALAGAFAAAAIVQRFVYPEFLAGPRAWLATGLYSLLFCLLIMGMVFARAYHRLAVDRAAQVERTRAELARAELRALRAQVNPHFLFNTLNTIASLIGENPPAAEDLTTRLADVFRYALDAARREHVPFADELEFMRTCLAIERARFGDRLRVEESIAPGLGAVPVPPLLLQPLVENAVRHGVTARPTGGTVWLEAAREGDRLCVTVADDGPGFDPAAPPRGAGVGLETVRERLRLAGEGHALAIDARPGGGTRIRVWLPLVPAVPEPIPEEAPCSD